MPGLAAQAPGALCRLMSNDRKPIGGTREQFAQYAISRDPALRDELVTANLGLARILAGRLSNRGETYDDLFQVASLALIKAVERFEPERGVEFSTFATRTVLGELKHHFRDKAWAVRAPRRLQELYLELGHAVATLSQELSRSPTVSEVAVCLGVPEESVLQAMEAGQGYRSSSIDVPDDDQEPLSARLGEDDASLVGIEDRTVLAQALATLPEREQLIVHLRFFEGLTQSEIAVQVGLSQMHVSRLLTASLEKLRPAFVESS
jgi:RNA polymerase sigma-B factor